VIAAIALTSIRTETQLEKEVVMALANLTEYLYIHNIAYLVISHSPAYTAQGIAGLTHISGKNLAKTVIVKLGGRLAMAVLPAKFHVNLVMIRKAANAKTAALASEDDFKDRFPQCETGAMPSFGNLFSLYVLSMTAWSRTRKLPSMQRPTGN